MIHTSHLPENRLRFLETFFGPGNGIAWSQLVSGGGPWGERVRPWVEDLRTSDRPVLLPRVGPGGRVDWYALAFDPRQARTLRDELTAFLGTTRTPCRSRRPTSSRPTCWAGQASTPAAPGPSST